MDGRYVFRVTCRLEPERPGISVEPSTAETTVTVSREAPEPGTEGWLFFRDTLWRGQVGDDEYGCQLAEEWLGEPVESIAFQELQVDEAYFESLKEAIADDLEAFNAETVSEVLSKYLGSSIRVTDGG
ncbi:LWR-salt protein [Natronolimnohabitans sp. A-GB9]|uniref:LWR-salt protein n=1 Tax=Natronolimnohabitans sp. A-GB9 TaxID=3069757 RepID=UPI0027AE9FA2|nr:LWR-salt protein [Natronolimnohabitans sp. A-GB9]MDQ2050545.1 LWR-salt protein [Natronolimnohabitans sp. A-GB9]